jgi:hypothetical protein
MVLVAGGELFTGKFMYLKFHFDSFLLHRYSYIIAVAAIHTVLELSSIHIRCREHASYKCSTAKVHATNTTYMVLVLS